MANLLLKVIKSFDIEQSNSICYNTIFKCDFFIYDNEVNNNNCQYTSAELTMYTRENTSAALTVYIRE